MRLYLMRHGEAEFNARDDMQRSLTSTGRAAVASKTSFIEPVDRMVVSPYLRALQSSDILIAEGLSVQRRIVDERVTPDCDLQPVIDEVILPDVEVQLIVAHNPLLTRLIHLLCGEQAANIQLDTADLACLTGDFLPGCSSLLWLR